MDASCAPPRRSHRPMPERSHRLIKLHEHFGHSEIREKSVFCTRRCTANRRPRQRLRHARQPRTRTLAPIPLITFQENMLRRITVTPGRSAAGCAGRADKKLRCVGGDQSAVGVALSRARSNCPEARETSLPYPCPAFDPDPVGGEPFLADRRSSRSPEDLRPSTSSR
jgi:hypothetical protein